MITLQKENENLQFSGVLFAFKARITLLLTCLSVGIEIIPLFCTSVQPFQKRSKLDVYGFITSTCT